MSEIKIYHSSSCLKLKWNSYKHFSSNFPSEFLFLLFPPLFLLIYLLIYLTYPYFHYIFLRIYIFPTKFHSFFQKGQKFPSPSIFVRTCAPRLIRNDTRVTRLINQKSTDEQDYHYRYFNVPANFIREK